MQVDWEKIPSRYILQSYTTNARQDLPFDMDDRNLVGKDGETKAYRVKLLLSMAMSIVRHGSMVRAGFDKAMTVLAQLIALIEPLEPNIGGGESCVTS